MNKKLYVGNLPYRISDNDLQSHFEEFGQIVDVKVLRDPVTGRSRGFGFVSYSDLDSAQRALAMDGFICQGRRIYVKFAREKQQSPLGLKIVRSERMRQQQQEESVITE